jgi:hypothetical protein
VLAADSPNLSGTWSGSAKGFSYSKNMDSSGGTTSKTQPVGGAFAGTIVQTGSDLSIDAIITPSSSGAGGPFEIVLLGKAGDFAAWATGVDTHNADTTEQVFLSGHFTAKGDKLVGAIIFYHSHDVTQLAYSLKKTGGLPKSAAGAAPEFAEAAAARAGTDAPFKVTGSANGKSYTFSSNASVTYKATVSGMIDPSAATVSMTFGDHTYTGFSTDADNSVLMALSDGSENVILFLKTPKNGNSASGNGWIYSSTRMVDMKVAIKKQ